MQEFIEKKVDAIMTAWQERGDEAAPKAGSPRCLLEGFEFVHVCYSLGEPLKCKVHRCLGFKVRSSQMMRVRSHVHSIPKRQPCPIRSA